MPLFRRGHLAIKQLHPSISAVTGSQFKFMTFLVWGLRRSRVRHRRPQPANRRVRALKCADLDRPGVVSLPAGKGMHQGARVAATEKDRLKPMDSMSQSNLLFCCHDTPLHTALDSRGNARLLHRQRSQRAETGLRVLWRRTGPASGSQSIDAGRS